MTILKFVPRYTLGTPEAKVLVNKTPFRLDSVDLGERDDLIALVFERAKQLGSAYGHLGAMLDVNYGYLHQLKGKHRRIENTSLLLLVNMASYLQLPLVQVLVMARPRMSGHEAERIAELVRTVQQHEAAVTTLMTELGFRRDEQRQEIICFVAETSEMQLRVGCSLDASEYGPMAEVCPPLFSGSGKLCLAEKYLAQGDWQRHFVAAFELVTTKALIAAGELTPAEA